MKIASRKSRLALWQAEYVSKRIGGDCEIVKITTKGDKIIDVPLSTVGGKGFFVKEVDNAVSDGRADIAVHSLKDMPTEMQPGLVLAAIPKRDSPYDALLSRFGSLESLPYGSTIGTSSTRRTSEVLHRRPDLKVLNLRGNVDTRVRKATQFDAVILAEAGLRRLGYSGYKRIRPEIVMPAACQGAIGIVARNDDKDVLRKLKSITHRATMLEIEAERSFIIMLEGGCQIPAGALGRFRKGLLRIRGSIGSLNGSRCVRGEQYGAVRGPSEARRLGERLGLSLLRGGGAELLKEVRG